MVGFVSFSLSLPLLPVLFGSVWMLLGGEEGLALERRKGDLVIWARWRAQERERAEERVSKEYNIYIVYIVGLK